MQGTDSPPRPSFRLLISRLRENKFLLFEATRFVVICYTSLRNLTTHFKNGGEGAGEINLENIFSLIRYLQNIIISRWNHLPQKSLTRYFTFFFYTVF